MNHDALVIESATCHDVPRLSALGRSLYRTYFAHLWTEAGFGLFLDAHFDEGAMNAEIAEGRAAYYLMRLDDETIGFAKTRPNQQMPNSPCIGTLLEKLYFLPAYTCTGLGQRVLTDLIAKAEAQGAKFLWLDVLKSNERARRAYEKAGFVLMGEIPFATDRHDIGFFIMRRMLTGTQKQTRL